MNQPSADECVQGFERILDKVNPQQMAMLRAHYQSGGRAVTMRELATAAGYADYKMANLQYGNLAKRLYTAMGFPKPISPRSGNEYWILGLGEFTDRGEYGLEMNCVMRPEISEALELVGIVEKNKSNSFPDEIFDEESVEMVDVDESDTVAIPALVDEKVDNREMAQNEIIEPSATSHENDHPGDSTSTATFIQDFIVYHNPDAMGPLEPGDGFGVVTNRPIGSAMIGDRVWLITGEGTPRKYSLASWFYIGKFESGESDGCKYAITGNTGQNFDPFVEIEQVEWFTQLKQDQGNFAFGFSRINTPGAVEALKTLSGFHRAFRWTPDGKVEAPGPKMAAKIENLVRWLREVEQKAGLDDNELDNAISGLLDALDAADLFLDFDEVHAWMTVSSVYLNDQLENFAKPVSLLKGDLVPLQSVLSRIAAQHGYVGSGGQALPYWRESAKNGEITILLRGFEEYLQFHKEKVGEDDARTVKFEAEWSEETENRDSHYMLYWQERSVTDHASNDLPLDVIASNQLMRLVPGDSIWIVTLTEERELVLAGRMVVGEIVGYEEAIRRLPNAGLWQAEYYAFPEPGTEEYLNPNNIHDRAEEIRFESENDRLIVRDGAINPQQLQSMRKLTRETADLFEQLFEVNEGIHLDDVDPVEALELLLEFVQNEPDNPHAHYNLGVALCNNGMDKEAIAAFERTLELDPDYFVAQYNLGNTLIRLGRFEGAIEELNKAILTNGEYAPAHLMLGVAYHKVGRYEDAVAATRQGLEIDPSDDGAFYNIAYWTFQNGDYRRAIGFCDDVISQFPFFTSPHVLKGQCFRELGELDNEIRAYRSAVDIKVDDEGAFVINMTALFFLAAAWERRITGRDEGIEYVEADNYFDLRDPLHQFCFAMGHLAQGDTEDAADTLESLRETSPDLARRLEFAIAYVDRGFRDTQPVPVDVPRESQPEVPRQTDVFAGDTRRNDPAQTQPDRQRKPRKLIRLIVDGTEIVAKHNPDLYSQVLKILVEKGALDSLDPPISSGRKRYLVSRSPIHKDGSNFLAPVEYGGYFMESHSSREQGMKVLRAFLDDLGITSSYLDEGGVASELAEEIVNVSFRERVVGSLLGLAVCDALGTTAEFKSTGTFPEITAMVGGGPYGLNPGEWTDDTSMALCLAESLVESDGFNAKDQMDRYLRWKNEGHLSSNGRAFDIGITIRTALDKYERQEGDKDAFCGSVSPAAAGNGSLMRLAPVPIYFAGDPGWALAMAVESSRTTHGALECLDACRYFAGLIVGALQGRAKDELLSPGFSPVPGLWESDPLSDRIAEIANGSFKSRKPPQISSTGQGYVVLSLYAGLWAFHNSRSFNEGALKVVNLGYDSDTYGAIYGQLAGAFYGSGSISTEWLEALAKRQLIEQLAVRLIADRDSDS